MEDAVGERDGVDAEYTLESAVRCPYCRQEIGALQVVRMLRTKVNFTSTLPRRGSALVCPQCGVVLAAELGNL